MKVMTDVRDRVSILERGLRETFGSRLQSLVTYGLRAAAQSAARDQHGTHVEPPRMQTLVIVETLTGADLTACAAHVGRWHDAGLATPLLLAANEFGRSLDAFPLE